MRAVAIALVLAAAGCSSGNDTTPDINPNWKQLIDDYVNYEAVTDKQRQILADYWVSDEELNEIHDDYLTCMANLGFINTEVYDDDMAALSYRSGELPHLWKQVEEGKISEDQYSQQLDELSDQCMVETWNMITTFYTGMRHSPDLIDTTALTLECLIAAQILPEGSTRETLSEAIDQRDLTYEQPQVAYCYENAETWTPDGIPRG